MPVVFVKAKIVSVVQVRGFRIVVYAVPPPRAAVCGTIIGLVASCRCEDAPQPRLNNSEISSGNSKVIVYPRNIARFIKQAESYGVNTDKINNSFINFVKTLQ